MTGTKQGAIDFEWLLSNIEVGQVPSGVDEENVGPVETFVLGPKAIFAAEAYVLGLFQMYPTVYFHKATRGAEMLFTELLCRVINLILNGDLRRTGLTANHPLTLFARNPNDLESVLRLDDVVLSGALASMVDAKDPSVSDFAKRLRNREFYKAVDVRETVTHILRNKRNQTGEMSATEERRTVDRVCANIREKIRMHLSDAAGDVPRILMDQEERAPYKPLQESKGPLNQIHIRVGPKELVDLGKRSSVISAIQSFKLFRVYIEKNDTESRKLIYGVIAGEMASV